MSNWSGPELVKWLRKQAHGARQSAGKAEEEAKREKLTETGRRLDAVADALGTLLDGSNPDEGIGQGARRVAKALQPGTRVRVVLAASPAPLALRGTMNGMSRYSFLFNTDDGRRLIVEKHAVLYWQLEEAGETPEGQGEEGSGE